ncbi:MAG: transposase [Candidatus Rokubacteria bacterium]|nr:transposase [Candidatus Rokubacteria bacterium]
MLSLRPAVRIFAATAPTNMHLSFDRLAALARDVLQQDPLSGHAFAFFNRSGDIDHVRFTYACHACEGTVLTAALPAAPIEKGRPGPGLLAQVITAKDADHLPLNRQVDIFARHRVTLARQTLTRWTAR